MAKVLEPFFPEFSPSPLQKAINKRIHEYEEELKQYGMAARSAMQHIYRNYWAKNSMI